MHIETTSEDWKIAREVFQIFSKKEGADHIASLFALAHLAALLRQYNPHSVLEFGAGIGTITYLILMHQNCPKVVVSVEDNTFCLRKLKENIPNRRELCICSFEDVNRLDNIFDVIIIDSSVVGIDISKNVRNGSIIFAEGSRKSEREWIEKCLDAKGMGVEFINYDQGTRMVHFAIRRSRMGWYYPKIKLMKKIKGCWIGMVKNK